LLCVLSKKKKSILICVFSIKVFDLCVTNESHSYKQTDYCKFASKKLFLNKLKIIKDIKELRNIQLYIFFIVKKKSYIPQKEKIQTFFCKFKDSIIMNFSLKI